MDDSISQTYLDNQVRALCGTRAVMPVMGDNVQTVHVVSYTHTHGCIMHVGKALLPARSCAQTDVPNERSIFLLLSNSLVFTADADIICRWPHLLR